MKKVLDTIRNNLLATLVAIFFCALVLVFSPTSRNLNSVITLFRQGFAPAILAMGVLFNINVGNWDFAVGSEVLLASIIGGNVAYQLGIGPVGMFATCVLIGLACAAIVAVIYRFLNIPTLIASIGMLLIYESISSLIYDGNGVNLSGTSYLIYNNFWGQFIVFAIAFALAYILFYRRRFGYKVRAVGSNMKIAEENGVDIRATKMGAMIVVGLFAGIYSLLSVGSLGVQRAASNMTSMSVCFDAMMCVFVGMAINGKKGNAIFSTYCGAIIMQVVKVLLIVFSVPSTANKIVIAGIVTVLMVISNRSEDIRRLTAGLRQTKKNENEAVAVK